MTTRDKYERLRDALGMTDYEVMRKAGVEKSTFYTWRQRSEDKPGLAMTVPNMQKVAQALGVTLDQIVGDAT